MNFDIGTLTWNVTNTIEGIILIIALSLSGDGNTLVVCCDNNKINVYTYDINAYIIEYSETVVIESYDVRTIQCSIATDGNSFMVLNTYELINSFSTYKKESGSWIKKDTNELHLYNHIVTNGTLFVASTDTVIYAYNYDINDNISIPSSKSIPANSYITSIDISDTNTLIIGTYTYTDTSIVNVYNINEDTLNISDPIIIDNSSSDTFGEYLAISNDGQYAIISEPSLNDGKGQATVWKNEGLIWSRIPDNSFSFDGIEDNSRLGANVAISSSENGLIVSFAIPRLTVDGYSNAGDIQFHKLLIDPVCIHKDTLVLTNNGYLQIQDIRSGTIVIDKNGKEHQVIRNIEFYPTDKFIMMKSECFNNNVPNADTYLTKWHPIYIYNKEVQPFRLVKRNKNVNNVILNNMVPIYSLCTEKRVFVMMNNLPVCTWADADFYKFCTRKSLKFYKSL